jgi:hypothetical protein
MFLIKDFMGKSFPKEGIHMPFRANPTKKTIDNSRSGLLPSKSRSNTSAAI